jgi:hypothetical protein
VLWRAPGGDVPRELRPAVARCDVQSCNVAAWFCLTGVVPRCRFPPERDPTAGVRVVQKRGENQVVRDGEAGVVGFAVPACIAHPGRLGALLLYALVCVCCLIHCCTQAGCGEPRAPCCHVCLVVVAKGSRVHPSCPPETVWVSVWLRVCCRSQSVVTTLAGVVVVLVLSIFALRKALVELEKGVDGSGVLPKVCVLPCWDAYHGTRTSPPLSSLRTRLM